MIETKMTCDWCREEIEATDARIEISFIGIVLFLETMPSEPPHTVHLCSGECLHQWADEHALSFKKESGQ